MTEQYILTEILGQLIEHDLGVKVEITKGIGGGTTNIQPALLKGDFDLYPEYTGTAWLTVLKLKRKDEIGVVKPYEGYGNGPSLERPVRLPELLCACGKKGSGRKEYGLKTFSDRRQLREPDFRQQPDYMEAEDGYPRSAEEPMAWNSRVPWMWILP